MPRADARIRPCNGGKAVESPNVYHFKNWCPNNTQSPVILVYYSKPGEIRPAVHTLKEVHNDRFQTVGRL